MSWGKCAPLWDCPHHSLSSKVFMACSQHHMNIFNPSMASWSYWVELGSFWSHFSKRVHLKLHPLSFVSIFTTAQSAPSFILTRFVVSERWNVWEISVIIVSLLTLLPRRGFDVNVLYGRIVACFALHRWGWPTLNSPCCCHPQCITTLLWQDSLVVNSPCFESGALACILAGWPPQVAANT